MELDVSDILAAVRVPTLLFPRPSRPGPAHYAGGRIRGSQVIDLPPFEGLYTWVDHDAHEATMAETARFVARLTEGRERERVLATILFTDIVGSTELAARLGDTAWRELLERHHAIVRRELARFRGRELDTAGDGFFASFDGPARAVQAAPASIPASSRSATARSSGSASRSARASRRSQVRAKSSCRAPSRISSPDPG
jgi:hypothetical protein